MRKLQFLVLLVCLLASCDKGDLSLVRDEQPPLMDDFVSASNEVTMADVNKYVSMFHRDITKAALSVSPLTSESDTLAYVLNFGSEWEVISAHKRGQTVLIKGEGPIDLTKPGVAHWLNGELEFIKALKKGEIEIKDDNEKSVWKNPSIPATKGDIDPKEENGFWELVDAEGVGSREEGISHLLQTRWGQWSPWNACVPYMAPDTTDRCPAGCVAISGSQMLYYLHYKFGVPQTMYSTGSCIGYAASKTNYSYQFTFGNATATAWDDMARNRYDWTRDNYKTAVLIGYVGHSLQMQYAPTGSGADMDDLADLFSDFGISSSGYSTFSAATAYQSVKNDSIPIIVAAEATDPQTNNRVGHSWVIDGYKKVTTYYDYTYMWSSRTHNEVHQYGDTMVERDSVITNYFKMNWGWADSNDDNLFGTNDGSSYIATGSSGQYNFSYDRKMISGFYVQ